MFAILGPKFLSGRGKSLGIDVVMALGLKGEKLAGEQRKFQEKEQIKVPHHAFFPPREKIAGAVVCSGPRGCPVPGERRAQCQAHVRWATLNVSACCNTALSSGAPSAVARETL